MAVQTPEAKVKQFVRKFMNDSFPGIFYYAPPGGPFGQAGIPDYFYLWKGVFIAIEVKADNGKLTESQQMQLKRLAEQGAIAAVVYGKDVAKMEKIKRAILAKLEAAK